jgi:hypothetical protein
MKRILAMLMIAGVGLAHAWPSEPSAVAGLPIGADISTVKQCPAGDYGRGGLCIGALMVPGLPDRFRSVYGMPDLGFPYTSSVTLHNGRIASLTIKVKHMYWDQLKVALASRYGQPTAMAPSTVQTIGGAKLGSDTFRWNGKAVNLVAIERAGRIDESVAMFTDILLFEATQQEQANKVSDGAKKL